jgi:maltooligosyltrehalose trehalohydrolase
VALTGRNEAYYTDYNGNPQEFISAAKYGYLFQGQLYTWQEKARGQAALDVPPPAFIAFIENHDQVSNSTRGARLRQQSSPGRYRALTALLLLGPWTPMLFQGQEYGATTPFLYFCDLAGELGEAVQKGRFEFLAQFPSIADPEAQAQLPRPSDPATFARCKLDRREAAEFPEVGLLHRDLLRLRKEDARFREQKPRAIDGATLTAGAFILRYFGPAGDDRLLLVNFGKRTKLHPLPEPLLAPPFAARWEILWNSESICYGGQGSAELITNEGWILPAEAAVVLHPVPFPGPIKQLP